MSFYIIYSGHIIIIIINNIIINIIILIFGLYDTMHAGESHERS